MNGTKLLERLKAYLGLGPSEDLSDEMSGSARIAFGVVFFLVWIPLFAAWSAFSSERSFVEALPSAVVGGLVAAGLTMVALPWFVRRSGRD